VLAGLRRLSPATTAGDPLAEPADRVQAGVVARAMTYAVFAGLFLAAAWTYRQAYYQGQGYPKNTFLFAPGDHFRDLYNFFGPLRANDPLHYAAAVYPPFAYIMMEPFVWVGWTGAVVLFVALTAGGIGWFLNRQLDFLPLVDRLAAVFALTFATYPFLFTFDRGNIEIVGTLLIVVLAWAMQTRRWTIVAVAVGAAAALKGYPAILGAPLLVRGMWKQVAIAVAVAALLTLLGTIYYNFDVSESWNLLHARLTYYNDAYVVGDAGLAFSNSLFAPLKILIVDVLHGTPDDVRSAVVPYEAVTTIMLLGIVWALWKLPLKLWQQVTLLVCALNLFPTVSGDYKLLNLIVPLGLFLREGTGERYRWWYFGLFALLMIPKSYAFIRPGGPSYAIVVNPLLMTALAVLVLVSAWQSRNATHAPEPTSGPAPVAEAAS
jgi:Glycosyltransferase family 87